MALLGFGQPQTGIMQMAYVVEDIDSAMRTVPPSAIHIRSVRKPKSG